MAERDEELRALAEVLEASARGTGGAVVIRGGIGCGKTELLTVLKSRAADAGFLLLSAVGSWPERRSPGAVLSQLLCDAPELAACRPVVGEVVRGAVAAPEGGAPFGEQPLDSATAAALHGLCAEVTRAAARVPVLLCVDDVQFADPLSMHWILHLLRVLRSARIVLVLTDCTLSRQAHPQLHSELLRQPNYVGMTVPRLGPDGVAELLGAALGAPLARELGDQCHAVSGGNPLLVRALAEDHRRAVAVLDRAPDRLVVGESFGDTVLSCLHRGRPVLLRVAQTLALLDERPTDPARLARVLDEDVTVVARGIHALETAGLFDGGRLRHPLARKAVVESLAVGERRALHARLAAVLYEEGAAATQIAEHVIGGDVTACAWTVPVLREAAERYLLANRTVEAHACLDAALRSCDDDAERVVLRALVASTAWVLNPSMSARHLGELTVALRAGRLPDQHALKLAKYLLWHGRFEEASHAIERMEARGHDADPAAGGELRATRELLSATYPGLVAALRPGPGDAADPRIRGAASLSRVLANGPDDRAVADAEAALRTLRLSGDTQEWLMCAVAALSFADRHESAAIWCDHWLGEARARHVPLWEAEFSSLRAGIALRQGDPLLARRFAGTALERVPAESWGVCLGGPVANLVQAAVDTGDLASAAEHLEIPLTEGVFNTRFGLYLLHARGRYHLAAGHPYAALDDFTTCGEKMRRWAFDHPTVVPWRSEAARAHLAVGEQRRAQFLAREELEMTGPGLSRARGVALCALAEVGPAAARVGRLTEAVENLQKAGDRVRLAGALADLARAHVDAGRAERALPALEMAVRLADEAGVAATLGDLGEQARRIAALRTESRRPEAAVATLSGSERRVAVLAARGCTNREISERLTITASTVEQHLTRIFRKLGVRSRQELPAETVLGG
ncbi:AAA family ATPase [Streptomyces sp. NPDC052114]|uniref:ATP-binding protein n=1 Tax=unclassified Streptomyces TaxID=2593676 RepID=UPI0034434A57